MKVPGMSISTSFNYDIPIDQQIAPISRTGFSCISLGENEKHSRYLTKEGHKRLKELLNQHNLGINTIHGPRIDLPDSLDRLKQISIAAKDLNVSIVVVHVGPMYFTKEELLNRLGTLLKRCKDIEVIAEDMDIIFALENPVPGPATDLVRCALAELNPDYFGSCYDSSHDQIGGPRSFDLVHELKDRLVAVHISDRIKEFVDHVIPGEGFINWNKLAKSLKEACFKGSFVIEVVMTHSRIKEPLEFLKLAYEKGNSLYEMISTNRTVQ